MRHGTVVGGAGGAGAAPGALAAGRVPGQPPMSRMRRVAGYGAALAVLPYLLVKIAWTLGLLVPTAQLGSPEWRAVNAVTVLVAAVGILLALAFCQPWGERLPGWLVALPVWVGTGLLVPMVLLAPVLGPAAMARDQGGDTADWWAYEQLLIMLSLVGVGVGLPLALAGYARARWPEALTGPVNCGQLLGHPQALQNTLGRLVAAGCVALGLVKIYWAAGGDLGIQPDRLADRDAWWHLLTLSTGGWALAGAWGLLVLTSGRGARRFLPPMAAAWVSSGMLFAYNLFAALRPDTALAPEHPLARTLTTEAGIVLGVLMGIVLLLVLHQRRGAAGGPGQTAPDPRAPPPRLTT